ncbi:hypothetical protein, partial [Enterobacter sp. UNJFSC 003]|uniref:hypothetical protein n=1 Tax=Enterobacter sp. UNJFSC 003 TaxID=3122077 RepID=UPI002EC64C2A|nr:hypothetical protein [Serratia liquefaciens]
ARHRIEHREPLHAIEIGVQLCEQAMHRGRELGHVRRDFGGDLVAEIALRRLRQTRDRSVDRRRRPGNAALGRRPAHHRT